ncbi:MFS transporter [Amycolatopsis sp. EV170708-02-1]|uniref:MFS transporter n=1 Tax=Amycolatopsis sp. EV170708-02-1 TaxID=2919322 RepID=UPI001F0C396F|nr:MFS transporter [Amycolatopsis sp. EV170708-02-1]UMP00061.1 MFS transporter [Amycolatopsis sp. EV170708-02-1]
MPTQTIPGRFGPLAVTTVGLTVVLLYALEAVIGPALPELQRALELLPSEGALLMAAKGQAAAVATAIMGPLGDRYGPRRTLVLLLGTVVIGGAISATAASFPMLLAGQILEGLGIGAIPLVFALTRQHTTPDRMKVLVGMIGGAVVAGGVVGNLLAGPIAGAWGWRWIFGVPALAVAAIIPVIVGVLPAAAPRTRSGIRLNWGSALVLSAALIALTYWISSLADWPVLLVLGGAAVVVVLALLWIRVERRGRGSLVDLRLLAIRGMRGTTLAAVAVSTGVGITSFLVPQMLAAPAASGIGFDASTTQIGQYLLPGTLAAVAAGPLAGWCLRRWGPRLVIVYSSLLLVASSLIVLVLHDAVWQIIAAQVLANFATNGAITALYGSTIALAPASSTGTATGMIGVLRIIGMSAGAQVAALILTFGLVSATHSPSEHAFMLILLVGAVISAFPLVFARLLPRQDATPPTSTGAAKDSGAPAR